MEALIDSKELSNILGVKEKTIRTWTLKRKIPFIKIGALVKFSPSSISKWTALRSFTPVSMRAILLVAFLLVGGVAQAKTYSDEAIVHAIGHVENSKSHPYGILKHYKHTTAKQACLNTVRHARRDWNGKGDFLSFLQRRYAPIGVSNDPRNLNKNWLRNLRLILAKNGR